MLRMTIYERPQETSFLVEGRLVGMWVKALEQKTAQYLGLGLGMIVNVINPECIYLDGEITAAWDLIEKSVVAGLTERALTEKGGRTPLRVGSTQEYPRLRGAAALIAAPRFAAPQVA